MLSSGNPQNFKAWYKSGPRPEVAARSTRAQARCECPECHAKPGEMCKSWWRGWPCRAHADRIRVLAVAEVFDLLVLLGTARGASSRPPLQQP